MTYVHFSSDQVSGTEMSKWLNELCPIILDMLQDASLIAKREVSGLFLVTTHSTVLKPIKANRFHPPPNYACTVGCGMGREPGGWYSTNVYMGSLRSYWLGPTRYPFIYHFSRKRYSVPLSYNYLVLTNGTRYTYLV